MARLSKPVWALRKMEMVLKESESNKCYEALEYNNVDSVSEKQG